MLASTALSYSSTVLEYRLASTQKPQIHRPVHCICFSVIGVQASGKDTTRIKSRDLLLTRDSWPPCSRNTRHSCCQLFGIIISTAYPLNVAVTEFVDVVHLTGDLACLGMPVRSVVINPRVPDDLTPVEPTTTTSDEF